MTTAHTQSNAPSAPPPAAMPLGLALTGQRVEFVRVEGGSHVQHRLAELGLTPGVRFQILNRGRPGPFIIRLKDARLVLGHGMVLKMRVRPVA